MQATRVFSSSVTNNGTITWSKDISLILYQLEWKHETKWGHEKRGTLCTVHTLKHLKGSYWDKTVVKHCSASVETWKGIIIWDLETYRKGLINKNKVSACNGYFWNSVFRDMKQLLNHNFNRIFHGIFLKLISKIYTNKKRCSWFHRATLNVLEMIDWRG